MEASHNFGQAPSGISVASMERPHATKIRKFYCLFGAHRVTVSTSKVACGGVITPSRTPLPTARD